MKEFKLVLRKPKAALAARLLAFNKVNVTTFFSLLKELRLKFSHNFPTSQKYSDNSNAIRKTHLKEINSDEINNRTLETDDLHSFIIAPNFELND